VTDKETAALYVAAMVSTRRSKSQPADAAYVKNRNHTNIIPQNMTSEGTPTPSSVAGDERHATLTESKSIDNALINSIADVFQSQKSTGKSTSGAPVSIAGLSWKPDVSIVPERRSSGQEKASAGIDTKHGNSYKAIEASSRRRLPPKNASKDWFQLPTQEITGQLKTDLRVLRLRSAFDPKQFYKKFDETKFPTQFHVGTVVEPAADFYSSRLTNKQRKSTMAEEIMHDPYLSSVRKKRYNRIQDDAGYWSRKPRGRKTDNPRMKKKPRKAKH
jgi:hypothetical protein